MAEKAIRVPECARRDGKKLIFSAPESALVGTERGGEIQPPARPERTLGERPVL
jgi:hypothetical protein